MRPPPLGDRLDTLQPESPADRDPGSPARPPVLFRVPRPPYGPGRPGEVLPRLHEDRFPGRRVASGTVPSRPPLPSEQLPSVPPRLDARCELPGGGRAERVGGKPVRHPPRVPRRPHRGRPRSRLPPLPRRADAGERPDQCRRVPVRPALRVRAVRTPATSSGCPGLHAIPGGEKPRGLPRRREDRGNRRRAAPQQPQLLLLPARARLGVRPVRPCGGSPGIEDLLPLRSSSRHPPPARGGVAGDRRGLRSDRAQLLSPREASMIVRRAQAALLGGAVGDALGATTEFMKPAQIRERIGVHREITGGGWLNLLPGQGTHDTELTLCVARGVIPAREGNLAALADRFAHLLSGAPGTARRCAWPPWRSTPSGTRSSSPDSPWSRRTSRTTTRCPTRHAWRWGV